MRRAGWLGALVVLVDVLVLSGALAAAWRIWLWWRPQLDHIVQVRLWELFLVNDWMPPGVVLLFSWVVFLRQLGFYDPVKMYTAVRSFGALSAATIYTLVVIVTFQFLAPQRFYSRFLVVTFLIAGFLALAFWRWALLRLQERRPLGLAVQQVLIVGTDEDAMLMYDRLHRYGRLTYEVAGFMEAEGTDLPQRAVPGDKVLGTHDQLREIVNEYNVTTLIIATRSLRREQAIRLATECAKMGLRALQVPFTWGTVSPRLDFAELGQLQLIDISRLTYPSAAESFKRWFDLVVVTLMGVVLVPMFLVTALAIRLDTPGGVLFSAPRVGRGGRAFPFFKFRSMVQGADAMKEELLEHNETDGPLFKIKSDPRITRVGRFIRKYSIDEFPQFWNVVRGDMNLVGPRPLPVKDLEGIEDDPEIAYWFELRHQVSPGITGLWQVKGRSDLGFEEMVNLDVYYIQNWSPWLDLKILLMTIPAVLKGRGAS